MRGYILIAACALAACVGCTGKTELAELAIQRGEMEEAARLLREFVADHPHDVLALRRQVFPDGVSREHSVGYHIFVTDLYLFAVILARKNNMAFSEGLHSRLQKMCEFLLHMRDEKGNTPSIGDSDDGLALKLNISEDMPNAASILNTASVVFNSPDFRNGRGIIDEKKLWLLGRDGYERHLLLNKRKSTPISKGFPDSGYYIMRHKDLFLTFDCGLLGYNSLAAHGHADALGITLSLTGRPILVDPGTYLYHSGGRWRDYFRSTKAHNTLRIDKKDQSEMKGPFIWGYKARSFLKYWSPNGGYDKVCGYHTGYTRLTDPVVHTREIVLNKIKRKIIIKDSLVSEERHLAEIFFHLHPDCIFKRKGNRFEIFNRGITVFIELDNRLNTRVFNGKDDPICGWYSERFGRKTNTNTICAENYFKGSEHFITKISIGCQK